MLFLKCLSFLFYKDNKRSNKPSEVEMTYFPLGLKSKSITLPLCPFNMLESHGWVNATWAGFLTIFEEDFPFLATASFFTAELSPPERN